MKKKNSIFRIILLVLLSIILIFAFRIYKMNKISSNVEVFSIDSNVDLKFAAVLDNKFYKYQNERFIAFNKNGEEIFSIKLFDLQDVIYDKSIYLVEKSGKVKMIDRNNAREIKSIDTNSTLLNADFNDKKITLYSENSVIILDDNLKVTHEIKGLNHPVKFLGNSERYSVIELNIEKSNIYSTFKIVEKGETKFALVSDREAFLDLYKIDDNDFLVTSSFIYSIKDNSIINKKLIEKLSSVEFMDKEIYLVDNMNLIIYDQDLNEKYKKNIQSHAEMISVRKNSIVILSFDKVSILENDNLISENAGNWLEYSLVDKDLYLIYEGRVQRVNTH